MDRVEDFEPKIGIMKEAFLKIYFDDRVQEGRRERKTKDLISRAHISDNVLK